MKTRFQWLLGVLLTLGALLVATPLLFALLLDQDTAKRHISNAVESRSGRPLLIDGDLSLAWAVKPRIRARALRYPNAPWATHESAIEVDEAVVTLDPWALLRGKLLLAEVAVRGARLRIEKNADGVYNLAAVVRPRVQLASAGAAPPANKAFPAWLAVSALDISDTEISIATARRHWDIVVRQARAQTAAPDQPVAVSFHGDIEQTPVSASATLGSLQTLFARRPSALSANGWVGADDNRVSATGSVRDVLKWRGVNLQLEFSAAQLPALSELARVRLPPLAPLSGQARLWQPEGIAGMQLRDIQLHSRQFGLRAALSGEITHLFRLDGLDLNLSAAGPLAPELTDWARDYAPGALDARVSATLRGSRRNADLRVEAHADNAEVSLSARGGFTRRDGGRWRAALPVSMTVSDFAGIGIHGAKGAALAQLAPATATAELRRERGVWHLRDIALSLAREALGARVGGDIERLGPTPEVRLSVTAEAADGRYLQPLFAEPLPPLSELSLASGVTFARGGWHARVDALTGRAHGVALAARGAVADLSRWRGIELDVTAEAAADDLRGLPPAAARALAVTGPLRVRAKLANDDSGDFHLTDIDAVSVADPARHIGLSARGEIRHLETEMRADLDWEARLDTLAPLVSWLPDSDASASALAAMALPLEASGRLHLGDAGWGISGLTAVSRAERMTASLSGDIASFAPPQARLHLTLADLATADLPTRWKIPRPPGGELALSLDLVATADGARIENLDAAVEADDASLSARGAAVNLSPLRLSEFEVEFDAARVAALGLPRSGGLQPDNPASGRATLALDASGARADIDVAIGASDLRGALHWRRGDGAPVPAIDAKLVSDRLDLRDMLVKSPKREQPRLFSPLPLDTRWLRRADVNLEFTAGEARSRLLDLRDVTAQLTFQDGTMRQRVAGRMGRGELEASLAIDANARPLTMVLAMNGAQLDTAGLVALRENEFLDSGEFDFMLEFAAEGDSPAALAGNADGRGRLRLSRAKIKNQSVDILGGDIFSNIITAVNPFRQIGEYVEIECGVMRFDITDGVAQTEDGLAVKTDKVTLLGGGHIDLGDESLKILLLPKARKGFGINSSSLAQVVRVGGTLASPKIEGDASRLPETVAAFLAAFYTGGWSLIAKGLIDRSQANAEVCGLDGE